MILAAAGERLRNAGRVTCGSRVAIPFGPELPPDPETAIDPPMSFPAADLLAWYARHRRDLPWRARPGEHPDPYRVWLSEIMLQQTTVTAVIPYFERFLARFPTVEALARAGQHEVLAHWAGLGYYARGRNLHACAQAIVRAGRFPTDVAGLRALPGIGAYTASAVAAIAFGIPTVPVDGNVERVTARLFAVETPLPQARPILARLAATLGDQDAARAQPSDFAQALFDLGATLCTPRRPACALCPWRDPCAARGRGIAETLPARAPKPGRPVRHGAHFWLEDGQRQVLLRRRPSAGLFAGMTELPGTVWRPELWPEPDAIEAAPMPADWRKVGSVSHTLTHLEIRLDVYAARVHRIEADGFLVPADALAAEALPTIMRKCAALISPAPASRPAGRRPRSSPPPVRNS
jgi:A/G-specific adenine glycosylase